MHSDHNASPINQLPMVVWILSLPVIAMEIVLSLGQRGLVDGPEAIGWRLEAVQRFAFSGDILKWMISTGNYPGEHMLRLVSYPLVHASPTHAIFVVVFILALGKMVGEIFRAWAVLTVFFGAAIVGALAYTLLPGPMAPLIGGYPPVYGLIGAFTFILWVNLAGSGASQYRAFTLIGFLLGIQLVFGLLFGGGWDWVADLAGFAAGFFLSFVVSPGGWGRVVAKLRRR